MTCACVSASVRNCALTSSVQTAPKWRRCGESTSCTAPTRSNSAHRLQFRDSAPLHGRVLCRTCGEHCERPQEFGPRRARGKVPTTIEAGAFASYQLSDSLYLRAEALKGLGGHDGIVGTLGADQIWRDGDRYVFSIGPRVLFSDNRYQRAYFGVSPAVAVASGLPAYRPSGGIHGVAAASSISYQFSPRWGMFGYGRYARLVGDAAKSPIVRELGSRNQLSGGVGLSYTFTMKR